MIAEIVRFPIDSKKVILNTKKILLMHRLDCFSIHSNGQFKMNSNQWVIIGLGLSYAEYEERKKYMLKNIA